MKLEKFLKISQQYSNHPNIISESIGDAILYNQNYIFRNLRNTCLNWGYTYSTRNAVGLATGKFTLLDAFKKNKNIPYLQNFKILSKIHKSSSYSFELEQVLFLCKTFNPLLHESAHMACHELLTGVPNNLLVNTNLGEGFADTVEFLFYTLPLSKEAEFSSNFNLYKKPPSSEEKYFLNSIIKKYGFKDVIKIMILLGLYAHFYKNELSLSSAEKIISILELTFNSSQKVKFIGHVQQLFELLKTEITPLRAATARFYFKQYDLKGSFKRMFNSDPFIFVESKKLYYQPVLEKLALTLQGLS